MSAGEDQEDQGQPKTPGCLFCLPPELRAIVLEMVIFNPPPRVCSLAPNHRTHEPNPNLQRSDGLFVYDCPALRYVCQQTCGETIQYYSAAGWQMSYQEPPKRPYKPRVDVLFCSMWNLSSFLEHSESLRIRNDPEKPVPMAAVQVQKARHIALEPEGTSDYGSYYRKVLLGCPKVKKVSIITPPANFYCQTYCVRSLWGILPKRPLALGTVPNLEPIKFEISEAGISEWIMRYFTKKAYAKAEKAIVEFATNAGAATGGLRCRTPPQPQPAILLQMSSLTATEEGEVWEELGPLPDPLRETN